jgi:endonuclease/exonuclease/phosphatase family metal-dependent hydrolase
MSTTNIGGARLGEWVRRVGLAGTAALALAAGGCHSNGHSHSVAGRGGAADAPSIAIDGQLKEWPQEIAATADADWIYLKVTVEGNHAPLQASPETVALWLDVDGSPRTGARMAAPADASGMGVDEIVEFSPPGDKEGSDLKRGVVVYATDETGKSVTIPAAEAEVLCAPTCEADMYEVRISRHIDPTSSPRLAQLLAGPGRARAMFALIGRDGKLNGWSDPETFTLPPAARSSPMVDETVPPKGEGVIRVLSWNVLKNELMKNPAPFARVIQVVDPDVILLQEWETDAATAQAWFTATVTGAHAWNAWSPAGSDVAIVSPYPLSSVGPLAINAEGAPGDKPHPVRFVSALAQTPKGDIVVGTVHLKCCGTMGSPEDARRINEANAINAAMVQALSQTKTPMRVIAGDFNLVGTRAPLDIMRAGLDADGSELAVAPTPVLGDRAIYTWSDHKTEFPDGRLDYAVYSDSSATLVNAFVIDGRRLSDKALARMGLDRSDTAASDHFPVVVDLKAKR